MDKVGLTQIQTTKLNRLKDLYLKVSLPVLLEPDAGVAVALPDGFSSLGTNFCMSACPNSQPGGRLQHSRGKVKDQYTESQTGGRLKSSIRDNKQGRKCRTCKWTHLLGVQRDNRTVLSQTREQ